MPAGPLCPAPTPPHPGPLPQGEREQDASLSCLPGPLCHARRVPSVMPPAPLCHARRPPSVMPAGSPLSFPPVVSGNPGSCFVVPCFVVPFICVGLHGRSHGFPIKNVGNDRRGIEHGGHDGMPALPLCHTASPLCHAAGPLCHARRPLSVMPPGPLCHSRRLLAGIQCLALLFLYLCGPCMEESHGFPIKNVGNDRRGD